MHRLLHVSTVLMANLAQGLLFDGFGRTPWMGVKFTKPIST